MSETLLIIQNKNEAQEFITNIILVLDKLIETINKENTHLRNPIRNQKENINKIASKKLELLSIWYELGNAYKRNQNIILNKLKTQQEIINKIDSQIAELDKVSSQNMILSLAGIKTSQMKINTLKKIIQQEDKKDIYYKGDKNKVKNISNQGINFLDQNI